MCFLEPQEVAGLAEVIDPHFRAFLLLGAYRGLRLGEMLDLRRERVDLLRRQVDVAPDPGRVKGHITFGSPKTSAGRRAVPIPRVVAEALEEQLATVPLRIHDLRHSAVAFWIAAGASPEEIAVRAEHTSVAVVLDRYGHLLPGSEQRVSDALDIMASNAAQSRAEIRSLPAQTASSRVQTVSKLECREPLRTHVRAGKCR